MGAGVPDGRDLEIVRKPQVSPQLLILVSHKLLFVLFTRVRRGIRPRLILGMGSPWLSKVAHP
jgi:hypothetical protein